MAKQKSPPLHFTTYVQSKDGNGYDLFTDLPIEERRRILTAGCIHLTELYAKSKGLTIEKIERPTETA